MTFTVIISLAIIATAGMAAREAILFSRKRAEYPPRRLTLRLSTAGMLCFLLGSVLVGVRVFGLDEIRGIPPVLWIAFWGCVALLTGAIICLAIGDLRSIGDETYSETSRIWHDIARTIAEHEERRKEGDGQPDPELHPDRRE